MIVRSLRLACHIRDFTGPRLSAALCQNRRILRQFVPGKTPPLMTHQDTEPAATRDSKKSAAGVPAWSLIAPAACWLLLVGVLFGAPGPVYASVLGIALIAGVLSAVHHAEVVAHRVGEPFGTAGASPSISSR